MDIIGNNDECSIFNGDCFDLFSFSNDNSIDLMVLDLPYANMKFGNCTALAWDTPIDLDKMWVEIKRILKPTGIAVFFCDTKFGYCLIHTNPKWFKYQLIWKKSRKVGFLSCNKQPLRQSENIYVFKENQGIYNAQKTKLEKPSVVNRKNNQVSSVYGDNTLGKKSVYTDRHPTNIIDHENMYVFKEKQGTYNPQKVKGKPYKCKRGKGDSVYAPSEPEYVTENSTGDRHPTNIVDLEKQLEENLEITVEPTEEMGQNLYVFKDKNGTYNPQKTKGKPYKTKARFGGDASYYRKKGVGYNYTANDNQGDRFPSNIIEDTILEYNNPIKSLHSTQKPVKLLEWLIKTYSNEDDTVMDFTMGSGSTGEACLNTKRKFIGCERDEEIYETAHLRLVNHAEELLSSDE